MMNCERCGKEIPENIAICPSCGTITSSMRQGYQPQPPTQHGSYPAGHYNDPQPMPSYGQGYSDPQPPAPYGQGYAAPQPNYMQPPQPNYGYGQQYGTPPAYPGQINVNIVNHASATNFAAGGSSTSSTPVLVEVLLSLFLGIYGVGWLMAGETTTGVVLLICSFVLYWPIMIVGIIFTLGLGVFCLGPLAIGAIIVNAILLNNTLKRKARMQFVMAQSR